MQDSLTRCPRNHRLRSCSLHVCKSDDTCNCDMLLVPPGILARPGLLYRAALEGATYSLLAGLRRMQSLGLVATELRLVGGGSKNPLWQQIVADVFELPVR